MRYVDIAVCGKSYFSHLVENFQCTAENGSVTFPY